MPEKMIIVIKQNLPNYKSGQILEMNRVDPVFHKLINQNMARLADPDEIAKFNSAKEELTKEVNDDEKETE
jgi:hypothetical protein